MPPPHAVCRRSTVTRASRSKARLQHVTIRRGSWRSHVHRTHTAQRVQPFKLQTRNVGGRGALPSRSLGGSRGPFSHAREWPPLPHPCGYAGKSTHRCRAALRAAERFHSLPIRAAIQPPALGVKRLIPLVAFDVPAQTPHCLGSVFVIALPAEAADLVQRFHVPPKPQCHRAVDDLRVRIVLFRVRRNFLVTEDDLGIPYLRRVQRKRRRHTAADIPAERRHLVAVHFIGNNDHRAVAPVPVNVRRKGLMRHQIAVVALPVCVCPVRRAVSLHTGQHP